MTSLKERLARVETQYAAIHDLMEAKFVTYFTLITANEKQVKLALEAADKAIQKSDEDDEKRFDSVNEFRRLVQDIISGLVRQDYLSQALSARDERLTRLEERNRELELARSSGAGGQAKLIDQRANIGIFITIATFVIGLIVFLANYVTRR